MSKCREKKPGIEPVFTELPFEVITKKPKNVSVIYYRTTNREGFFLIAEETIESLKELNEELYDFPDLRFSSKVEAEAVANNVRRFYLGDKDATNETIENLLQLYGDINFDMPLLLESELMVNTIDAPIYNYYFEYAGGRNMVKELFGKTNNEPGASHGDDILYLFTGYVWPYKIKEKDQKIIDWMTKMWTDFAKYGYEFCLFVTGKLCMSPADSLIRRLINCLAF